MSLCTIVLASLVLVVGKPSSAAPTSTATAHLSIPYVATRNDAVKDMLWMAKVAKDDVVYDLGSGDGRIVIAAVRDFGARRVVGIESDPARFRESRENAHKAGVTDRVELIQGDLFAADFGQASVVTLFLGHGPNLKLRPKMFRILKPGTRIVSHQFGMGEWEPDKALTVRTVTLGMWGEIANPFENNPRVPDYTANEMHFGTSDKVLMWVVPAPVAGIWRGKIDTADGPRDCQLVLHQRLSQVTGTFQLSGGEPNLAGYVKADLWGDHLRFQCIPEHLRYGYFELRFDGHIRQNTIRGTLAISQAGQQRELPWQAERDKADFRGTWQWPCSTGERPVKLKIERHADGIAATYVDRGQAIPVPDLYDCGGGFYFTLLIGRDGDSLKLTNDTGWLIGEAILDGGSLKGKIEFYPYEHASVVTTERKEPQSVIRNWAPQLIQP